MKCLLILFQFDTDIDHFLPDSFIIFMQMLQEVLTSEKGNDYSGSPYIPVYVTLSVRKQSLLEFLLKNQNFMYFSQPFR